MAAFDFLPHSRPQPWQAWLGLAVLAYTAYRTIHFAAVVIHRLYISDLARAKIPGPKLAALTYLYESYYEVWLGGQMFRHVGELHKKYGPIVRITPDEVHVDDPEAIDTLYPQGGRKAEKPWWFGIRTGAFDSIAVTVDHDQHRQRRNAVSSFFSPASVHRLEHVLRSHIAKMMRRLDEHARRCDVVQIHYVFKALASDFITYYAFDDSLDMLDAPDYGRVDFDATDSFFRLTHLGLLFPWLMDLVTRAPMWLVSLLFPRVKQMQVRREYWNKAVSKIRTSPDPQRLKSTIFEGILSSKLPASDKTDARMTNEAHLIVFAGEGTTSWTMQAAVFEILANPRVLARLQAELATLGPRSSWPEGVPPLAQTENLSYLAAIVDETVRVHPAVMTRQMRVSPDVPVPYRESKTSGREWLIPPGVVYSMSPYDLHMREDLFADPYEFRPERWIEKPRLSRYLLGFGRGSRNCLGMNLARRELALVLATLFAKYDLYRGQDQEVGPTMELYETTRKRDVDPHREFIQPFAADDSLGVRIRFRA